MDILEELTFEELVQIAKKLLHAETFHMAQNIALFELGNKVNSGNKYTLIDGKYILETPNIDVLEKHSENNNKKLSQSFRKEITNLLTKYFKEHQIQINQQYISHLIMENS